MQVVSGIELAMLIAKTAARWERLGSRLSICRAKKPQSKLARALLAAPDVPLVCGKRLLGQMPVDIIVHIFLHLDVADVLRLAQVSRVFHNVSQYLVIWQALAYRLMTRGRRVALHDFLSTSSLSAAQLRQSVLVTVAAEKSWRRNNPKHVSDVRIVRLNDVDLDHASYVMKFTSRRHLVLPTKAGELIGWDTRKSARSGNYSMGPDSVLINVQGDYTTRSLYWITGKMSSDLENENNLLLMILRIQFPEPASTNPVVFEELGTIRTPWSLAAELHFLDASQRMICAVFECTETQTTGLNVILDWTTGLSYICDTGVPYEYGRAVIGLHLSEDKKSLILHTEFWGTEVRRAYSIAFMQARASVWNPSRNSARHLPRVQPAASASAKWQHDLTAFTDRTMSPHTVWVLPQWWPTYSSVQRRTSTIILYSAHAESEGSPFQQKIWRAAQHYSDAVGQGVDGGAEDDCSWSNATCDKQELGGAPCSSVRSVVDITNPVLINLGSGLPILAQSFNHLGWIEEREVDLYDELETDGTRARGVRPALQRLRRSSSRLILRRQKTRMRRSLKLVSFPDPGVSPRSPDCTAGETNVCYCSCTTLKPVTLDVPECVLNQTYHMFLDPAAGTITLATEDNELHVYQYGRAPLLDRRDEDQFALL